MRALILFVVLVADSAYPLNVDDVRKIISDNHATTIEMFLDTKEVKQQLRGMNVNLVYKSRSLQGASLEFPRAIVSDNLSGNIADPKTDLKRPFFAMSFNGDRGQKGFYNLEIIEFNRAKGQFHFSIGMNLGEL